MMFNDEIQRIGDQLGLKGKFTAHWGFDHIIAKIKELQEACDAALKAHREDVCVLHDELGYCIIHPNDESGCFIEKLKHARDKE